MFGTNEEITGTGYRIIQNFFCFIYSKVEPEQGAGSSNWLRLPVKCPGSATLNFGLHFLHFPKIWLKIRKTPLKRLLDWVPVHILVPKIAEEYR